MNWFTTLALIVATGTVVAVAILWRRIQSLGDKVQTLVMGLTAGSLVLVSGQLLENNKANIAATRGQLYQKEDALSRDEREDEDEIMSITYLQVPARYQGMAYRDAILSLLDADSSVTSSESAAALVHALFDVDYFKDSEVRKKNKKARELFLHSQEVFYHIHNAHDYWQDGILSQSEWDTWKGQIREMGANPMLLAVIWQGWQYKYFSRKFGRFLQGELCSERAPENVIDREKYERDRNFIRKFYPEMMTTEWLEWLPDY